MSMWIAGPPSLPMIWPLCGIGTRSLADIRLLITERANMYGEMHDERRRVVFCASKAWRYGVVPSYR